MKWFGLSVMLLVLAAPAFARADRARAFTGGPVVGVNVAGLGGDAELDLLGAPLATKLVARERPAVGGFAAVRLHPRASLRVEVLYSRKGAKSSGADPADPSTFYDLRYSTSYLAIPVLATYDIPYDREFTPRLFLGPEIDVRLDSELTGAAGIPDMTGAPQMFELDEELSDRSAGVDVAVVVGAGIGMPVGGGSLVIDVRYAQGVTAAVDAHEVTPMQGVTLRADTLRNQVFGLVASYEL